MHVFVRATEDLVEQNNSNADHAADSDQAPIDVARDHAFAERRDQAGLRRRQWMWTKFSARCANKTIGLIDQIKHWRNHNAPAITPIIKAACCFHGVASTSCPVFRSCKLLLAIAATLKTTAVVNR